MYLGLASFSRRYPPKVLWNTRVGSLQQARRWFCSYCFVFKTLKEVKIKLIWSCPNTRSCKKTTANRPLLALRAVTAPSAGLKKAKLYTASPIDSGPSTLLPRPCALQAKVSFFDTTSPNQKEDLFITWMYRRGGGEIKQLKLTNPFVKNASGNSGTSAVTGIEMLGPDDLGSGNSSRPQTPRRRSARPARPHLCNYPLASLPASTAAKFTQWEGQKEMLDISSRPAPSPKRTVLCCPGSPLQHPWPWEVGPEGRPGKVFTAGRSPLLGAACRWGPLPSRRGPGFPSVPPSVAPRRPLSQPESCFHGSLGRPLLTNSLSPPVPVPPPEVPASPPGEALFHCAIPRGVLKGPANTTGSLASQRLRESEWNPSIIWGISMSPPYLTIMSKLIPVTYLLISIFIFHLQIIYIK